MSADTQPSAPLVEVRRLTKVFRRRSWLWGDKGAVRAVDGVDLAIRPGETLGLVGESGSGKSTLGRVVLNLTPASGGSVLFEGQAIEQATAGEQRELRRRMQVVFQDPYASLNPRMTVRQTLVDALAAAGVRDNDERRRRIDELLGSVGLAGRHADVYPHRLSGGQRQRVAIARALAMRPRFIVADEPVSALDLSIQAQILNLLADLQAAHGLTYLFISHDLNVIRYLSDRVAVMYRGRIVEQAPAEALFAAPRHPYTELLLSAMPSRDRSQDARGGEASIARTDGEFGAHGCAFRDRCPRAHDRCAGEIPQLAPVAAGHDVACFAARS